MTEAKIIKALEEISHNENLKQYSGIPMVAECTLDLINRKNAEIEKFADIGKLYSEIRSEAIKEFAERANKEVEGIKGYETFGASYIRYWQVFDCIDKIAKEMGVEL